MSIPDKGSLVLRLIHLNLAFVGLGTMTNLPNFPLFQIVMEMEPNVRVAQAA